VGQRWRQFVKGVRDFIVYRLLRADDPPYKLAMGVAVGMFVAFTPTMGLQMVFSAALAWIVRANMAVGLPLVWISNPFTMLFIYYPLYLLGTIMTGQENVGFQWFEDLFTPANYPDGSWPTVQHLWSKTMEVFWPLWLGCIVFGLALAIPSYYLTYSMIYKYRMKKWGQMDRPKDERIEEEQEEAEAPSHEGTEARSEDEGPNDAVPK
jgi:uncharacterized protein (DUF2062 family)